MAKELITKDMTISDVLKKYPETAEVFLNSGFHCLGCAAASFENIEQAAEVHGLDVKKLLSGLNSKVGKKK